MMEVQLCKNKHGDLEAFMDHLIFEMNSVAEEWREEYAPGAVPFLSFVDNEESVLFVNGRRLVSVLGLVMEKVWFDDSQMSFYFEDGRQLDVAIGWSDGEPFVESVWIGYAKLT